MKLFGRRLVVASAFRSKTDAVGSMSETTILRQIDVIEAAF
jgi:hypothetical protein